MKKTIVAIPDNVPPMEAYITDKKWNGFEVPVFNKENTLRILESLQNTNDDITEDAYERFNEEKDCVEVVMRENPQDNYCLDTTIIDGVKHYNVGSGWVWEEVLPMNEFVDDLLKRRIDDLFYDLHTFYATKSGDISPEQAFELNELMERLSKLITTQISQNL